MYCPKCGKMNDDDAHFCIFCGEEMMDDQPESVTLLQFLQNRAQVLFKTGYQGGYKGAVLMRMIRIGRFQWHWDYIVVVLGRFFLAPAAILGISLLFPTIPMLMRSALIVQASMPVMANIAIVAGSEGADSGYAAGGMVLTTILTAAFLPLLMMAMEAGWF